jgi:hypothetical protein
MSVNGTPEHLTWSAAEFEQAPQEADSFAAILPGGTVSVPLNGYSDPSSPGTTLLGTVDLLNNDLVEWPVAQQGQYTLQLEYAASAVPGSTDPCPGVSSPVTAQFSVGPPAAAAKSSATRPIPGAVAASPSGSPNSAIPSWLQVPEATVQTQAEACFSNFGFILDEANVLSDLATLTGPANNYGGKSPGYTVTLIAADGPLNPKKIEKNATYANPGAARIAWIPDPTNASYSRLRSPGTPANNCASLYHELAHVRNILRYTLTYAAQGVAITPRDADLDLVNKTNGRCTIDGDPPSVGGTITAGEARAIQAENAYRQWYPDLGFRTFHDYNQDTGTGSQILPIEGYLTSPPVCDDPLPLLYPTPYLFPLSVPRATVGMV